MRGAWCVVRESGCDRCTPGSMRVRSLHSWLGARTPGAWSHVKLRAPDWDSRIGRCVPMGNGRGLVAGGGKQRGVGKTQIVLKKRRIAEMFCVVVFCC